LRAALFSFGRWPPTFVHRDLLLMDVLSTADPEFEISDLKSPMPLLHENLAASIDSLTARMQNIRDYL
jgi:hypothetical protein